MITPPKNVPLIELNDGKLMPAIGLGTSRVQSTKLIDTIKQAIDIGYRHIDTAQLYKNEKDVGEAVLSKIEEGVIKREDIFITSKLGAIHNAPERVVNACKKSLDTLGLKYIDLYLIHFPFGLTYQNNEKLIPKRIDGTWDTNNVDYLDTWKEMQKCVGLGYARSIGVSNFNISQLKRILTYGGIKPVVNQIECSLQIINTSLIEFCQKHKIHIMGYCPLAIPDPMVYLPEFLYHQTVVQISEKYNKTTAQVALRYLVCIVNFTQFFVYLNQTLSFPG